MPMINTPKKSKLVSIGNTAKQLGISIDTLRRWDKKGKLTAIRVGEKATRYYKQSDLDFLLDKPFELAKRWAMSDKPNEPDDQYYCKTRDMFQAKLEKLQLELKNMLSENMAAIITAAVGEIGNNSYDHNLGNWKDVMGVFFGYSLAEKTIVLADRGQGVLTTLKRVDPDLSSHKDALFTAFTKTISGRYPENRGNGLKFVKLVVVENKLSLTFQTGNAKLELGRGNDEVEVQKVNTTVGGCFAVINF
jgi:DNA-binding transcriptional MerR regulator